MKQRLFCGAFLTALLATLPALGGVCTYEPTGTGLVKATCQFPSCPSGNDCIPPSIDRGSSQVELFEPLMKWADLCPDRAIPGACWEVFTDFKFRLAASDANGVSGIGVHFAWEVNARRSFKKFFGNAQQKDQTGRYEMRGTMTSYVPPGQRLELNVYEICARDGLMNEGCVLPARPVAPSLQ